MIKIFREIISIDFMIITLKNIFKKFVIFIFNIIVYFFNDIYFGRWIYFPALVGLYLLNIIWISSILIIINPNW